MIVVCVCVFSMIVCMRTDRYYICMYVHMRMRLYLKQRVELSMYARSEEELAAALAPYA